MYLPLLPPKAAHLVGICMPRFLSALLLLVVLAPIAHANSYGVSAEATSYAQVYCGGETAIANDAHTFIGWQTASANAHASAQLCGGYASAEMSTSALTSLGVSSVSTNGYGYLDTGQPIGTATSGWNDTFHAVGNTTFVLTLNFQDFFTTGGYGEVGPCANSVQYNLQVSALTSPVSLQDSVCNPAYANVEPGGVGIMVNGGSHLFITEIFQLPDGTAFTIGSSLYATDQPANYVLGLLASETSSASAVFRLRTSAGSYTTDSGVSYVPEPSSLLLVSIGLAGLVGTVRKKVQE